MDPRFNEFLKTNLNDAQLKAVEKEEGCFLVIAGAGSGKTRVITSRITNLILNNHTNPSEILALTFTNKAAREMKERIKKFLPESSNLPFIGTFHSFCLLTLKKNKSFFKFENFTILDDEDQFKLIKMILSKFALEKQYNARQIQYQISSLKNKSLLDEIEMIQDKTLVEILREYEKQKNNNKALDFDDLLIEVVKLFKSNKLFKEYFQSSIKHILVDEYQDTNNVQYELLKEMALLNNQMVLKSICAVGDEDQSIYSWRGAVVDNIQHFKKDFKNCESIKIEQNYRSINEILDIANHVIKNNSNRNEKKLWSEKSAKNRVILAESFSGTKEADLVAKYVKYAQKRDSDESIAVLYRTHFQSRLIEEAFLKQGINYKIVGGIQFYERKEIKDILAYLKLIINPYDKISFLRVLNCPTRGIGKKTEEALIEYWEKEPLLNFKEIIEKIEKDSVLPASKINSIKEFGLIFEKFSKNDLTTYAIKEIIEKTDYIFYIKSEFEKRDAESRIENLNELIRAAQYFEEQKKESVQDFLNEVALLQEHLNNNEDSENQVQLMTLHAAKGLEFDHVLIVGLEEGLLPSSRSLENESQVEEERRLFYVGITRAKEFLIVCNSQVRNTYGQTSSQTRSRFVDEIPKHKIHPFSYNNFNEYELDKLIIDFLQIQEKVVFKPSIRTFQENFTKLQSAEKIVTEWKKNHFAKHKVFGTGLIKDVEQKPTNTIITVQFKEFGIKKIDSKFLEKV